MVTELVTVVRTLLDWPLPFQLHQTQAHTVELTVQTGNFGVTKQLLVLTMLQQSKLL
jgi:hypothetical protein